jgi:hypothetical protein
MGFFRLWGYLVLYDKGKEGIRKNYKNQDGADPVIIPQFFCTAYRIAPNPRLKLITNVRILIIGMRKRMQSARNPRV